MPPSFIQAIGWKLLPVVPAFQQQDSAVVPGIRYHINSQVMASNHPVRTNYHAHDYCLRTGIEIAMSVSVGRDFGLYDVDVDGMVSHNNNAYASMSDCNVSFIQRNLGRGQHTIRVTSRGASPSSSNETFGFFKFL